MQSDQLMECPSDGARWLNSDPAVPCPRCEGIGKNITKMSIYKVLKALPSTMNQYEVGAQIELSNAEVSTLVEDGSLELVELKEEEDKKKEDADSSATSSTDSTGTSTESNLPGEANASQPTSGDQNTDPVVPTGSTNTGNPENSTDQVTPE